MTERSAAADPVRVVAPTQDAVEAEYRRLFVLSPDAHVVTTADGRITDANRRAVVLLGMPRSRLRGQLLETFVDADERQDFRARVAGLAPRPSQLPRDWDVTVHPHQGAPLSANLRVTATNSGTRGAPRLHWSIRDVTEAKLAQAALQAAFAEQQEEVAALRELDQWRDAIMAAAAHDLRSPLAGIRAFAETLLEREDELTPERRHHLLGLIVRTTDRMTRLLEDLLDLDRASRNAIQAHPAPVDLGELARELVEQTDPRGHQLEVDVADDDLVWEVDELRLVRAIGNLLDNALRHTPPGTPVRLAVHRVGPAVHIVVEDEGPGVPAEVLDRLFVPFVSHPVAEGETAGSGLGLSLVQLFVELHEGTVHHEARPGGGARFVVELPPG